MFKLLYKCKIKKKTWWKGGGCILLKNIYVQKMVLDKWIEDERAMLQAVYRIEEYGVP